MDSSRFPWLPYVRALLRRRWFVLAPAVFGLALAVIWTTFKEDIFEAESLLMAHAAEPSDGIIRSAVESSTSNLLRNAKERLYGNELILPVIREMNLYPDLMNDPDSGTERESVGRSPVTVLFQATRSPFSSKT